MLKKMIVTIFEVIIYRSLKKRNHLPVESMLTVCVITVVV